MTIKVIIISFNNGLFMSYHGGPHTTRLFGKVWAKESRYAVVDSGLFPLFH